MHIQNPNYASQRKRDASQRQLKIIMTMQCKAYVAIAYTWPLNWEINRYGNSRIKLVLGLDM